MPGKKKNNKKKKQSASCAVGDEEDWVIENQGDVVVTQTSAFAAMQLLGDDAESSSSSESDDAESDGAGDEPEQNKDIGKSKKEEAEDEDDDDEFAGFLKEPKEKKPTKAQLKRQRKKEAAAAAETAKEAPEEPPAVQDHDAKQDDLDDILGEFGIEVSTEKKLTKAQLKRQRKKAEAEAAKAAGDTNDAESVTTNAEEAKADKPLSKSQLKKLKEKQKKADKGKKSGPAQAIKERLRKQREEEERVAAELAAIKEQEEKEERERVADIERKEEARLKRIEDRAKRKEELKRKGLYLTPAQKEAKRKQEEMLLKLAASGKKLPAHLMARIQGISGEAASPSPTPSVEKSSGKKKPRGKKEQQAERLRAEARRVAEEKKRAEADRIRIETRDKQIETLQAECAKLQAIVDNKAVPVVAAVGGDVAADSDVPVSWDDDADSDVAESWDSDSDGGGDAVEGGEQRQEEETPEQKEARVKLGKVQEELDALVAEKEEEEESKAAEEEIERIERERDEALKREKEEQERQARESKASEAIKGSLRSPICCIMGHVDTGKTKLLDMIRKTNVQDKEAGGITQQIGATYFPVEDIRTQTSELNASLDEEVEYHLPGLLVIDTPGHESFTNLRTRGSNLCDIAILVVDIMHGLEQQTLESINMLREKRVPFVIALNKVDRLYGWKDKYYNPFKLSLEEQVDTTQDEFRKRLNNAIGELAGQSLNTVLYWENEDSRKWVNIVPTSAHTGEGIPDLLMLIMKLCQTMMKERMTLKNELKCTVMEVKMMEGFGYTLDVILVDGELHEGDTIVVCGLNGPIVTTIRGLRTPQPMKELRVKSEYVRHQSVRAAMGLKIVAPGLEDAIAGSQLLVCRKRDDIEALKDEVMGDLATILSRVDRSGKGVYVQSSTLGSLEALLSFLEESKIPVCGISIGPVQKKDVIKASIMLEHRPEFATILAFDVKITKDAEHLADSLGVRIFPANIIYHLFDMFTKYMADVKKNQKSGAAEEAVFPVQLEILPNFVFNTKDPIIIGVRVARGILKLNTPLATRGKQDQLITVGIVESIEMNNEAVDQAKEGDEVCVKIAKILNNPVTVMYGRHFDENAQLFSKLTRKSIDLLKEHFKDEMEDDWWRLVISLKRTFEII